ncbi:MAG: site-specific DNA-methyltransferase [Burkholderiales bacterium]|nr:site-specific DNA-methyltransferase [Burkholderiales bacterium]
MPELHWLGDGEAKREARRVPYRLLTPVEQVGDPAAQNLLIQGDNLEALKALLPFYAGRVKCIFIDPPYNTRSAFEHYDDNLEHSQWLSMMYPRLELLRELLAEGGSIWMTLDDNEVHYLKVICDEVLGRRNFIANMIWEKRKSRENRRAFSFNHDHLLVYGKDKEAFEAKRNPLPLSAEVLSRYTNPDKDPRGPWQSVSANAQAGHATPNQFYKMPLPSGRMIDPPKGRCWLYTWERMKQEIAAGNIWFGPTGDNAPRIKKFLGSGEDKGLTPETIWTADEVGTNDQAKKDLISLLPDIPVFDNPKPESLIQRVLEIASSPGELVLDSFLGSGTTAAVAHKMGRRYIGIEMGEHAVTHCLPRLKKVIEGELGGVSEAVSWTGGGGVRFMRLGEPVFREDGCINPAVRFDTLASYLWFLETGTPHCTGIFTTPLLGIMGGETNEAGVTKPRTALILLYNGILGDRRPHAGNVLTTPIWNGILAQLPPHDGPRVIYGEACRLSRERLKSLKVTFKQIPHEIRMR